MTDVKTDTLTEDELNHIHGGSKPPGHNQHGGASAVEREINEYLAAHPINQPAPALMSPILYELPRPAIDLVKILAGQK